MDEIAALREEVAKLRERIAVLEAKPQYQAPQPVWQWPSQPYSDQYTPARWVVTSHTSDAVPFVNGY